jgi:outer membrane protein assembly factor BamB
MLGALASSAVCSREAAFPRWRRRCCLRSLSCFLICVAFAAEVSAQAAAASSDAPELYLLIRGRREQEALSSVEQLIENGQHQPAIETIQWILDRPFDVLVRDESGAFRSARAEAERLFRSLPSTARDQYQRVQGATAAGEWNRVPAPHDAAACLDIVRSYFATETGYLASAALVSRWLDEGNADLAAALALRVIDDGTHKRRITTAFLRRAEMACRVAGRTADADRIRSQWLSRTADASAEPPPISAAPHVEASPRGFQGVTSAAPLPLPSWQRPFDSLQQFPQLDDAWKQWSAHKRDNDLPTALAWRPIVVGGLLIHRDLQALRALDIQTGATRWRYAARLGAEQLLSQPVNEGSTTRRLQDWETLFASSLTGTLTTDGLRVYAIDNAESLIVAARRNAESRQWDDASQRTARNSLIALNVWSDDAAGRLAWSTETGVGQPDAPLHGHAFLGPPTVVGGMAFCLTENDGELFAVALDAATGNLLWRQPIALADHSLLADRQRSLRAGLPTVSRGVVLCPTNIGLVVAVDAVTGQLKWYHSCLEPLREVRPAPFRAPMTPQHRRQPAFAPVVHAAGDRAVFIPSQSEQVFCVDLTTGGELWRSQQPDAEYLAGVADDRVIVVGRGTCRSLSLRSGEKQWITRLDSVPAGTGVLLADGFLLPLDSGRVLALDLEQGQPVGFDFSDDARPIGHLALSSDMLLAMGGDGVAAYPQAGPALRRLVASERDSQADAPHWLELADVYLTQGDLARGVDALQSALAGLKQEQPRRRAERTLREVYFRLLDERSERSEEWFARLAPLCQTADQKARRLIALSGWHLRAGRQDEALEAGTALAGIADDGLHTAPDQTELAVSIPVWLATLQRRMPALAARVSIASGQSGAATARIVEFAFRDDSQAHQAREHLALGDRAAGRWHGAELRWLRSLSQADRPIAARAARELARMYDDAGLSARAAEQLDLLSKRFADVELESGQTGADVVRTWPADSLAKTAWQRRQPIDWPIDVVRVQLTPRALGTVGDPAAKPSNILDDNSEGLYGEYLRKLPPAQPDSPYEWLIKSWGGTSTVMVFDKTSSRLMRTLPMPAGAAWPAKETGSALGSGQSLGVPSEIRCVSLLHGGTDGLAWSTMLPGRSGRTSIPSSGPATPFGAVFQLRNELIVVDPADGRVLWRRDDLEPGSGQPADSAIGLLADERVVFVLGADRHSYRIYDMATGQLTRQARLLDHDLKVTRSGIGTLIYHQAETPEGRSVRLWDAATDQLVLDDPVRERNMAQLLSFEKDLVWITPEGRLRVFQMSTRRQVVDCALQPDELEGVSQIRLAFTQGGRYFVNLVRANQAPSPEHFYEFPRDPLVPMASVRDDLIAVEPGCAAPLWRRVVPSRSYVQWGQVPAPVLVGASIIKARADNQRWLRVEVVDPATGLRLGYADRLPETRLYHAEYDGDEGVIRLIGERGDIELRFGPNIQQGSNATSGG